MLVGSNNAPSLNNLLAASFGSGGDVAARGLRAADSSVRAQAQQASAQGGAGSSVTTQYTYEVGPDGQLYATGATVTTSKRTAGPREAGVPLAQQEGVAGQPLQLARQPKSLADFVNPRPSLSPSDEAAIFGSGEFLDETLNSNEASHLARLQLADFGVRAQEGQHFRAASGLGSAPEYTYEVGPDGKLYAVAGEVGISTGGASSDEEAAADAATIARAALAATDVSAQDIAVARDAQSKAASLYASNNQIIDQENPLLQLVG